MTLLVVAGQVDLSVASMLGLGSALTGALWEAGWAFEMIMPVVLLVGVAGGLLNGWLVTKVGLPSLAVTIGTLALYRGLASVALGSDAMTDFPQVYADWAVDTTTVPGTFLTYPVPLFIVLAVGHRGGAARHRASAARCSRSAPRRRPRTSPASGSSGSSCCSSS